MTILRGKVTSGIGDFGGWIERLHDHYHRKTGLHLFPGTLNVLLDREYRLPSDCIRLEKEEYSGRVSVSIVPCRVFGRPAFIVRTDQNAVGAGHHPLNIIEIVSDVKLRDRYGLVDGSEIEVEAV